MTKEAIQRTPAGNRVIVALDVETPAEARLIVEQTAEFVGGFKIGLQLFSVAGGGFVRELCDAGNRVFLDVKFHDIPTTVAKASVEVSRLGVWMFNIHALGGAEMMSRTADDVRNFCNREGIERPKIIAVTVLTSANAATVEEVGLDRDIETQVVRLARLAAKCGLDGVVASPNEAALIRQNVDRDDFLIVTPGIRPRFATNDDQKRVMTPRDALLNGSDFLVVGRPITTAQDRREAARLIAEEIETD
jgi:orotidine-5'-phosphate decarboxylase